MISLLILVQSLDIVGGDVARPLQIEILVVALYHVETGIFAGVDNGVVDVRGVCNFESHE